MLLYRLSVLWQLLLLGVRNAESDRTQRINYCRSDVFIKFTKRTNSFAGIKALISLLTLFSSFLACEEFFWSHHTKNFEDHWKVNLSFYFILGASLCFSAIIIEQQNHSYKTKTCITCFIIAYFILLISYCTYSIASENIMFCELSILDTQYYSLLLR